MSVEKNTTMPENFDMSFAEDLGNNTVKKDTPKGDHLNQNVITSTPVAENIFEDLSQNNDAVMEEITAPITDDYSTEVNEQVTDIINGEEAKATSLFEDLTQTCEVTHDLMENATPPADIIPHNLDMVELLAAQNADGDNKEKSE